MNLKMNGEFEGQSLVIGGLVAIRNYSTIFRVIVCRCSFADNVNKWKVEIEGHRYSKSPIHQPFVIISYAHNNNSTRFHPRLRLSNDYRMIITRHQQILFNPPKQRLIQFAIITNLLFELDYRFGFYPTDPIAIHQGTAITIALTETTL